LNETFLRWRRTAGALEFAWGSMKKTEIAILSFKVLSIYVVLQSIYQVYNFIYFLSYQKQLEAGEKYYLLTDRVEQC
jgi:hypothetical protein